MISAGTRLCVPGAAAVAAGALAALRAGRQSKASVATATTAVAAAVAAATGAGAGDGADSVAARALFGAAAVAGAGILGEVSVTNSHSRCSLGAGVNGSSTVRMTGDDKCKRACVMARVQVRIAKATAKQAAKVSREARWAARQRQKELEMHELAQATKLRGVRHSRVFNASVGVDVSVTGTESSFHKRMSDVMKREDSVFGSDSSDTDSGDEDNYGSFAGTDTLSFDSIHTDAAQWSRRDTYLQDSYYPVARCAHHASSASPGTMGTALGKSVLALCFTEGLGPGAALLLRRLILPIENEETSKRLQQSDKQNQ